MTQSFIHYVPKRIIASFSNDARKALKAPAQPPQKPDGEDASSPWFARPQDAFSGFTAPAFHTTHSRKGAAHRVREGDLIWIVGQLFSPWGKLPPGIDARIRVQDVRHETHGGITYIADASSKWLPLADATRMLRTLHTLTKDRSSSPLIRPGYVPDEPIGRYLQSMRELKFDEPLEAWARELASGPFCFISYRICDGTEAAFRKVKELVDRGNTVFWDRWCLPRRLVERREFVSDAALDDYLMDSLRESDVVLGIETSGYKVQTSYAAKECATARTLGKYQPVQI